jgi:acyl-CoA thioester hydrolase
MSKAFHEPSVGYARLPPSLKLRRDKAALTHPTLQYRVRVYYQDTDAGGIVYHANYLNFGERARAEALRAMGIPHARMVEQHGVMFVVLRIGIDYQRPARLDDEIIIETRILEVGGASAKLRQYFLRDSDSLAVLEVSLGCVRVRDGRAARMPEFWRARMQGYL